MARTIEPKDARSLALRITPYLKPASKASRALRRDLHLLTALSTEERDG